LPSWEAIRPSPESEEAHRDTERQFVERGFDRRQQPTDREDRGAETRSDQGPHREALAERGARDGCEEHRDRDGQHPQSRLQRVESEDELQVQRHGEEDTHQDQILGQHRLQPSAERRDPEQVQVDERVGPEPLPVPLPGDERPQHHRAARHHEGRQREPERLDR
jgi:hypothetical protein